MSLKEGLRILVAYDGSESAGKALSEAVDIAKRFSGSVTLFHVYWQEPKEESLALLEETDEILKNANIEYELRSVHSFNPPRVITNAAEDEGFDLISIGGTGIGGTKIWLLGSVSRKVAEEARCPVLIAK